MMLVSLNAKGNAEGREELFLVHGAESVHRVMLDILRDLAQLRHVHLAQLVIGVRHEQSP